MLPTQSNLQQLEAIIEEGIATFYAVGSALLEIRDRELYAEQYPDFATYCEKRWHLNSSQISRRLQSAEIILHLDGPAPKYESHALELGRIDDPDLRNMAWAAAKERFGDNLTNRDLGGVVSEFVAINDPKLKSLVLSQTITAKQAARLIQQLSKLPDYYHTAVQNFGIHESGIVDPDALHTLRLIEYSFADEIWGVLQSGIIYIGNDAIPLYALTVDNARHYEKIMYAAFREEKQAIASAVQDTNTGAFVVSGENYSNVLLAPKGTLVWFFPERLSAADVAALIEAAGLDIYMLVGYTKGTQINFDGVPTDVSKLGGVKPQILLDTIEKLTCEPD